MIDVFRRSDYVICCLPLTTETKHCISRRHFEALGSDGWFINISRGDVVDQESMLDALNSGLIGGAVLDVTSPEPLPPGHALWSARNCYITPHSSWKTEATTIREDRNFLENARRFINEESLIAEVTSISDAKSENKVFIL